MSITQNSENLDPIDEFVDAEGGIISGGDRNPTNDSEIETGPTQKTWDDNSDYKKGLPTTTDRAARYRQNIPWFAVYSYRGNTGRNLPVNETEKTNIITKKQIEDEIKEDLVKKSKLDREVWDKNYDGKTGKIIDVINDGDLTDNQLEKIKKAVLDKIIKKDA